jgi:hypothetical protein
VARSVVKGPAVPATRLPSRVYSSTPLGSANPAKATARSIAPPNIRSIAPAFPREQLPSRALNRIQSAVRQALSRARGQHDADEDVIPSVAFTAGVQLAVKHQLGRAWIGCRLENPIGGYLAYQVAHATDARLDGAQVLVNCQNNVTADVVVW